MLRRIDDKRDAVKILSSLHNLKFNEDFQVVREYLESCLHDIRCKNDKQSDQVQTRWNQGAAQVLQEFFDKQDSAVDKVKKIQKR